MGVRGAADVIQIDFFVNPAKKPCDSCSSKKLRHIGKNWNKENYKIYCTRCGYFRFLEEGIIAQEGYAIPVQCRFCNGCQSWIRIPVYVAKQDEEMLRLVHWNCDRCGRNQRVSDSKITLDQVWERLEWR